MRTVRLLAVPTLALATLVPLGTAAGTAVASGPATSPGVTAVPAPCPADPATPKRQVRADWIASVVNIDWPSRPGLSIDQQQAELEAFLDEAVGRKLNAVVLQVRPTADTFWPSDLEPWSKYLTGTPGQDPGYDPLAFAVREAHERNLELHAWFNPYRVSMSTDREALAEGSPAKEHPDWVVEYGPKLFYDPGIPAVRQLTQDVIMEAVHNYDIDGVHFDDYFYPYPRGDAQFPDDDTFAEYGDAYPDTPEGRADWRRHNTDLLIQELDRRIHEAKPWVKLGVSPFAVWRNQSTDPEGSATTAGAETYDDLYADTRKWVRQEWLDYVAPQVYWNIGFAPAAYDVLVPWWSEQVSGTNVQLYIGQATYKVGTSSQDPAWFDPREMTKHLYFNRDYPEVDGDIYFSAKQVRANRLEHMDIVEADHYSRPALQPVTEGVPGQAPAPVRHLDGERTAAGVQLGWTGEGSSYAVYRVPGRRVAPCDLADASNLVGTVHASTGEDGRITFTDTAAPTGTVTYVVTALDRAYRESDGERVTVH
jgi:uncharacterized lipoprotein YddW (UPF0748 family)